MPLDPKTPSGPVLFLAPDPSAQRKRLKRSMGCPPTCTDLSRDMRVECRGVWMNINTNQRHGCERTWLIKNLVDERHLLFWCERTWLTLQNDMDCKMWSDECPTDLVFRERDFCFVNLKYTTMVGRHRHAPRWIHKPKKRASDATPTCLPISIIATATKAPKTAPTKAPERQSFCPGRPKRPMGSASCLALSC